VTDELERILKELSWLNQAANQAISKLGQGSRDRIYPAQDRDQWMALVNTVMNLWFS
jgi:hypothetical protein